jgi:hypothetical protein
MNTRTVALIAPVLAAALLVAWSRDSPAQRGPAPIRGVAAIESADPARVLAGLHARVLELETTRGAGRKLTGGLARAAAEIDAARWKQATLAMEQFVGLVRTERGKTLTNAQALELTRDAREVMELVNAFAVR